MPYEEDTKYWIYAGGLSFELTEGDIICAFSQYGEIEEVSLSRDRETGKSRGFCFIKYQDPRSCELAVDNFHGATIVGRKIKVSHANNSLALKNRNNVHSRRSPPGRSPPRRTPPRRTPPRRTPPRRTPPRRTPPRRAAGRPRSRSRSASRSDDGHRTRRYRSGAVGDYSPRSPPRPLPSYEWRHHNNSSHDSHHQHSDKRDRRRERDGDRDRDRDHDRRSFRDRR